MICFEILKIKLQNILKFIFEKFQDHHWKDGKFRRMEWMGFGGRWGFEAKHQIAIVQ